MSKNQVLPTKVVKEKTAQILFQINQILQEDYNDFILFLLYNIHAKDIDWSLPQVDQILVGSFNEYCQETDRQKVKIINEEE